LLEYVLQSLGSIRCKSCSPLKKALGQLTEMVNGSVEIPLAKKIRLGILVKHLIDDV
jgi:hypothetical protein